MDEAEQWQLDAALAALSADGRTLMRSLRTRLGKIAGLRARFEARSPAPRGELVLSYDETEIGRLSLRPGGLPRPAFAGEPARELASLTQATQASERVARRAKEIADAAPQLGLF